MSRSVQEIMTMIKANNIEMVDFKMVDINGQYRHVTIPARNFSESTMTEGIGCPKRTSVVKKHIPDSLPGSPLPECLISCLMFM